MPQCKKCNSKFPNVVKINDSYHNLCSRKYCLECSPFKQHNTKNLTSIPSNYTECICIKCNKKYIYQRDKGCTMDYCITCYCNLRRFKLKQKAVDYKGGSCERCGYNKCLAALDFHHIDPNTKTFAMGNSYNRSWKKLKEEIEKCIVLCSNCHREEHSKWAIRESNS